MGWFKRSVMGLFQYETPIALRINSKTLGVIQILLKILILCYVIGYVIVHQKGYQVESPITFAVTTKIKGVIFTNFTIQELGIPEDHAVLYNRIWDPTDYVIPGSGGTHGDFFILTNAVITPNQIRGVCPEEEVLEDARCSIDSDCILGNSHPIGNGIFTGKCVQGPNTIYKTCEVRAWCPVELDKLPLGGKRALLEGSRYSTVLIKNSIEFPLFGNKYKKRNILDSSSVKDLENCIHHVKDDPSCPIFRIGDIVEAAGENFSKVAVKGGVFRIEINWECDLDWDFTKHCNPRYSFERMDIAQSEISPGWNFRSGKYHEENRRTLYKNYGIKFLVEVRGHARKFNIVPLLIHLASCIALLKLTTYLCDIFLLKFMSHRHFFNENKFVNLENPDSIPKNNSRPCPSTTPSAGDVGNPIGNSEGTLVEADSKVHS